MSASLGETLAGLLNASFGNAVEIIVGVAALLQGMRFPPSPLQSGTLILIKSLDQIRIVQTSASRIQPFCTLMAQFAFRCSVLSFPIFFWCLVALSSQVRRSLCSNLLRLTVTYSWLRATGKCIPGHCCTSVRDSTDPPIPTTDAPLCSRCHPDLARYAIFYFCCAHLVIDRL